MGDAVADCLFCRIVAGEIPAEVVHESATAIAFRDIDPKAPTHVLIVPREHISTVNDIMPAHESIVGSLFTVAQAVAREAGLADPGYRLVMNCNEGAGQSVFHLHLHLLGGRRFGWPPG